MSCMHLPVESSRISIDHKKTKNAFQCDEDGRQFVVEAKATHTTTVSVPNDELAHEHT